MNTFKRLKALVATSTALASLTAFATPNLTPYQPAGWSDKIVVSTGTGSNIDSSPLTVADTLYVDWAVLNNGTTSTGVGFNVVIYVDGVLKVTYNVSALVNSSYTFATDYSIGQLTQGAHTVMVVADSGGVVAESNEADNSYTKNITVGNSSMPNLTPVTPSGWSDKIVVSTNTGTSTDSSPLMSTNILYVDWAVTNNGGSTASNFITSLYVDSVLQNSWTNTLATNAYTFVQDYAIGKLSAGSHTVAITTDSGSTVTESSEADNTYTKNITVTAPALPNLAPYKPTGWSDKIVIATVPNTTTDNAAPSSADTLYLDWAVINNGTVSAGSFTTSLYVDGVFKNSWNSGGLGASSYTYVTNYVLGNLSGGTHSIQITADSGSTVTEVDEADNSYTKMITVTSVTASAPTLGSPANGSSNQSTTPAFTWSSLTNVTAYRILVATNAADLPTNTAASSGGPSVVLNATSLTNAYTPSVPLNPGVTYYWEVHGISGVDSGTWSSVFSFTTAIPPSGLTIIPTFDSTITSDPNAATIETTINSAIAVYQSSFTDPITVNITFHKMSSGLGMSSGTYFQTISYTSYRAALASHAVSVDDTTALTYLPSGPNNPVTGNANVNVNDALARALGFTANPPGGVDGTVSLNIAIMNLSQATNDPSKYSLFGTVSHEIDEVLGFGTVLNGLTNGAPAPTGAIYPEDLFRYDAAGARSWTTDVNAASYFSLDGTTDLARYNQHEGGDFQDWYSFYGGVTPEVQDAYSPPGSTPVLGVELRALDVIGYTRALPQYTITASAGANGTISPSGTTNKSTGTSLLFTATPNATYVVNQWLVDAGVVQTGGTTYTLSNIQTNHTVQVTFSAKTNQTISFSALSNKNYGDAPFGVSATASSGLAVSFSIFSGPATIAGSNVTITGAGSVTVRAAQAGNANYNAAANVDQTFTVAKANQTITFGSLSNKAVGETFAVSATASSSLPVSFNIQSGPATLSVTNVTVTNTGAVVVRASQSGNTNYNAAANVDQSLTVYPPPTLSVVSSGTNAIISWPTNVPGFALINATNFGTWTSTVPSPVIIGGQYVVTNGTGGATKFYRLKK